MEKALLSPAEAAGALGISVRALKSPLWRGRLLAANALVEASPGRNKVVSARLADVVAQLPAAPSKAPPKWLVAARDAQKGAA